MTGHLISLDDEYESVTEFNHVAPASTQSTGTRMADNRPSPAQQDIFSDLATLMKAKKPYTSVSQPSPRPQLPLLTRGTFPVPALPYYANCEDHSATQSVGGSLTHCGLLSPSAKPFQTPGSVAAFLHEQDMASPVASPPSEPEYRKQGLRHLEHLTEQTSRYETDDETGCHPRTQTPSPSYEEQVLIPGLESPVQIGPANPAASALQSAQEPVVRLTKHVWDTMGADLESLMVQKRALEDKLAKLERNSESLCRNEGDIGTQIGKLRFQNEANRDQKASMGRSLALQEMEIKKLQLENVDLAKKLSEAEYRIKGARGIIGKHG